MNTEVCNGWLQGFYRQWEKMRCNNLIQTDNQNGKRIYDIRILPRWGLNNKTQLITVPLNIEYLEVADKISNKELPATIKYKPKTFASTGKTSVREDEIKPLAFSFKIDNNSYILAMKNKMQLELVENSDGNLLAFLVAGKERLTKIDTKISMKDNNVAYWKEPCYHHIIYNEKGEKI